MGMDYRVRLALLTFCTLISATVQAQSKTSPAFSVASIKRNASVNSNSSTSFLPGGRFSARFTTLSRLIINSYRIKDYQLSGGPDWAYSERYDVDAKSDDSLTRDEMRLMIQNLLSERFQLKIQRDTKELPVYALTQGKAGMKLQEAPDRPTSGFDVGSGQLLGYGVSMTELADQLSRMLDRPVIDLTAISGTFDLKLQYAPIESQPNAQAAPDPSAPDIVTAVAEQLGLRLEAVKAPIEVLVISRAVKPDEN